MNPQQPQPATPTNQGNPGTVLMPGQPVQPSHGAPAQGPVKLPQQIDQTQRRPPTFHPPATSTPPPAQQRAAPPKPAKPPPPEKGEKNKPPPKEKE